MKLVFVPLKDVFKECKGKRQFSIKKDAYRRFSSVSNEMQIGIKKIAALYIMQLPVADINAQNAIMHDGKASEGDIQGHVDGWIKAHQQQFDGWVNEALAAQK